MREFNRQNRKTPLESKGSKHSIAVARLGKSSINRTVTLTAQWHSPKPCWSWRSDPCSWCRDVSEVPGCLHRVYETLDRDMSLGMRLEHGIVAMSRLSRRFVHLAQIGECWQRMVDCKPWSREPRRRSMQEVRLRSSSRQSKIKRKLDVFECAEMAGSCWFKIRCSGCGEAGLSDHASLEAILRALGDTIELNGILWTSWHYTHWQCILYCHSGWKNIVMHARDGCAYRTRNSWRDLHDTRFLMHKRRGWVIVSLRTSLWWDLQVLWMAVSSYAPKATVIVPQVDLLHSDKVLWSRFGVHIGVGVLRCMHKLFLG